MTTWMTRSESARYLGVSLPTIDRMARAGKISKAVQGKRTVIFSRDELDQFRTAEPVDRAISRVSEILRIALTEDQVDEIEKAVREAVARVETCDHDEFLPPRGVCRLCKASLVALDHLGFPPGPVKSSGDVRMPEDERRRIESDFRDALEKDDLHDMRRGLGQYAR
jgi:excisionase family DNA binding protein